MPSAYYIRKFVPPYYYHIYNRGSRKEMVFVDIEDYTTFLSIISYYMKFPNGKALSHLLRTQQNLIKDKVNLINKVRNLDVKLKQSFNITAFCLMPNHFHLLLKQQYPPNENNNISNFMRRIIITYCMYFTKKYDHSGNVFQGKYKNILVDKDLYLLQLTKYIHRNPLEILAKGKKLENYKYSSFPDYLGTRKTDWLVCKEILNQFSVDNPNIKYRKFVLEVTNKLTLPEKTAID